MVKNRTVIFDLDNTLIDVDWRFQECVEQVVQFLEERLDRKLAKRAQQVIRKTPWISMHKFCDKLIDEHMPQRDLLITEAVQYYHHIPLSGRDIKKVRFFPYTKQVLAFLRRQGITIIVVTFGDPVPQEAKLRALDKSLFDYTYVGQKDKGETFQKIIQKHKIDPLHTIVIGDKKNSEIMAGNHLGFTTIQYAFGRHCRCPIQDPLEQPDFTVYNMKDLLELLRKLLGK